MPRGYESHIPAPRCVFRSEAHGPAGGENNFHFVLEADRSTMAHSRMAGKIAGYLPYYEQGLYKPKIPCMQGFLATTVTETRSRAGELRMVCIP
jgi:hypothetical protein